MAKSIRFHFMPEKFASAVAFLALKCPSPTKLKICKLLFYADKEHLVKYGRPITGDRYYKLEYGPVPTRGLDMLRGNAGEAEIALLEKYVSVVGNSIFPKRAADKTVFSKSDLEVMEEVCKRYGDLSATDLGRRSHKEASWIQAVDAGPMDYALFFEGKPEAGIIKELVELEQESRDVLDPFRAERR